MTNEIKTGTDLLALRNRFGITREKFAQALGLPQNVIHAWEAKVLLISPKFSAILSGFNDALMDRPEADPNILVEGLIRDGGLFPMAISKAHKEMSEG
jgi:DNA-binding XRE family transcriptional regulator